MWGVLIEGKREKGTECSVLCGMHWNGLTISLQASLCDSSHWWIRKQISPKLEWFTDGIGNKCFKDLSVLHQGQFVFKPWADLKIFNIVVYSTKQNKPFKGA